MNLNRIIILIFLIIFSLQSLSKADNIRDFEIEGMSIGDSALDYYSIAFIKSAKKYNCENGVYKSCKFFTARMGSKGIYTGDIQLNFKKDDPNYEIYAIGGTVRYLNNIKECYKKKKEISFKLEELFPKAKKRNLESAHVVDKTGKSRVESTHFDFSDGSIVSVECYDWTKEMGYNDHLRISIVENEYSDWLINEAFN